MVFRFVAIVLLLGGVESLAEDSVRAAITQAIPLLESGSAGSAEQRQCFTCHNQAVPVLALAEASKRGFAIDQENFQGQVSHTLAHLKRGRKNYSEGRGQGGGVLTAGYALWTLAAGEQEANEITAAVTHFLLEDQNTSNRWRQSSNRPPTSGSDFAASYVALHGLAVFATEEQQDKVRARTAKVAKWILKQDPSETEDRVFRLLSMPYIGADDDAKDAAVTALIDSQSDDGGWSQLEDMQSDAYATATALVALQTAGNLTPEHPSIRRGLDYLLDTQLEDGSWHVVTRANPFQTYFESGFPHGKDQFISMAASGWATLALTLSLPEG